MFFILGLLVRECFSFWTGHPSDFELWVRLGYEMSHGGNPYGILPPVPGLSFADVFGYHNTATIAYLPFWPLVTGAIYLLYSASGWDNRFFYYFLLKQPIILGDVALAYLIFSYVCSKGSPRVALWALSFWLFCPLTVIISGIWGMFDSIAISFVFLAMQSNRRLVGILWEGLAVFAKSVPIIYVAPLTMKRAKDAWAPLLTMAFVSLVSILTFVTMRWPLAIVTTSIVSTVGKGGWSMSVWGLFFFLTFLGVIPNLGPQIYEALGILWIPLVLVFTWIAIRREGTGVDHNLIQSILICTLAFLIFKALIVEQYALYLLAFAIVDVALWHPKRKRLLLITLTVVMFYLVVNNFFLVRFLSPIYPGFVDFETYMYQNFGLLRFAALSLSGTAFTCLNIKYLTDILKRK